MTRSKHTERTMKTLWKNPLEEMNPLTREEFSDLPDEVVNGIYKDDDRLVFEGKVGRKWILINKHGEPIQQGLVPDKPWQSKCNSLATYLTEWRKQRAKVEEVRHDTGLPSLLECAELTTFRDYQEKPEVNYTEADPHKYNKLLYAEDAKHSDTPWQWWELCCPKQGWVGAVANMFFYKQLRCRRKPDAPKRFIDFQMDLTDCTEEQFRQVQKWLFEQGYSWIQDGEEYISKTPPFTKIRTHKDGDIVRGCPSYTYTDCPTLTLEELGIQFEQEDPHKHNKEPNPDELLRDNALERFQKKAYEKFNDGMKEYNTDGENPLIKRVTFSDIEEEVIDLWMYVQAMKEKLNQLNT